MNGVSIVIPCYNLGEYLPEAVESARRQSAPPLEVIIVDDGSTDELTVSVLERYCREGLLVIHTPRLGPSAARNHGIVQSRGEYILCLDADDVLELNFLDETAPVLRQRAEVGIVTTYVELFGGSSGLWRTLDYSPSTLLWRNCIASASLFRKRCWQEVGGYLDMMANEDWNFWISIVERGWQWCAVPKPLYRYRVRKQSRSAYEDVHRAELLREMMEMHADIYRSLYEDVLVEMDAEIQRMEKSLKKYELPLYDLEFHSSDEGAVTQALRLQAEDVESQLVRLKKEIKRRDLIQRIREIVSASIPPGREVIVISRGDDDLLNLGERRGCHFPQAADGEYAGWYPKSSIDVISHLEILRERGGEFLVIPETSLWWLDYYSEFRSHLEEHYSVVTHIEHSCLIFGLTRRGNEMSDSLPGDSITSTSRDSESGIEKHIS